MSLQVWLPFNGIDTNQGLDGEATIDGDLSFDSTQGKIGFNCLNTSNVITITTSKLKGQKICTFAFWAYINSSLVTTNWMKLAKIKDQGTNSGSDMRIEVCPKDYQYGRYCFSNHNNTNYGLTTGCITSPDGGYYDQWVHFCFTSDGETFSRYMNGKLIGTCNYDGLATFSGQFTLEINNIVLKQDVRIYDECLNKKQIKELAKGLVTHYRLSKSINNLIPDTYTMSSIGGYGTLLNEKYHGFGIKGSILTSSSTGSYVDNITKNSFVTPSAGEYYTCSFWAKGNTPIFNFFYPDCCDRAINCQGYSSTSADGNNKLQLTEEWKYYWMIFRTKSGVTGAKNIVMGRIQPVSAGKYCYIAGLKFEKGYNIAPEWTPHPDDTEYYTYGYNTNIEKDVSGNGYDLEYSKIYPEIDNDSAIHKTSFKFTQGLESANSGIQYLSRPYFDFLTSTFTISCWVKLNSENTYSGGTEIARQYIISQGRDTGNVGFNIAYQDSKIQAFYGVDTSNNRRLLSTNTMSLFIWYHIVVTWDGSNLVLYINGVKNSEGSLSGVDYSQCSDRFVIGKMAYLYTGTATYFPFVGNISDVRIYSTALSEADIKELYNVRASLDKNGNYYTSDIVEE